jgi:hypothetical protein
MKQKKRNQLKDEPAEKIGSDKRYHKDNEQMTIVEAKQKIDQLPQYNI